MLIKNKGFEVKIKIKKKQKADVTKTYGSNIKILKKINGLNLQNLSWVCKIQLIGLKKIINII